MRNFIHDQPGIRIVFGAGSFSQLPDEIRRLGAIRVLIVTSARGRDEANIAAQLLGEQAVEVFSEAAMHVPAETARAACGAATRSKADCSVVIGGGSTIGLGKAIANELGLPILAVPTTYSGSEMTPIFGVTEGGVKRTSRDLRVLPKTVIYDPLLNVKLPVRVASPSGMNALAHCMAAIMDEDASPVAKVLAKEGVRAITDALPRIVSDPADVSARGDALYGSWLAGMCLASVRLNVHYRICHVLGGTFNLPHADVHTVMLPHTVTYNMGSGKELHELAVRIGAPVSLKEIGMPEGGIERAARMVMEKTGYNPKPIDYDAVRRLIEQAFRGL
jgi:maleylacetate reductase